MGLSGGFKYLLVMVLLTADPFVQSIKGFQKEGFAETVSSDGRQKVNIPGWFTNPPKDGFVGVSKLCPSIHAAREQAAESAVMQVLQAMGAEYHLSHESMLSGGPNASMYGLTESMSFSGRWFLRSIQQHILKVDIQKIQGGYICFLLLELGTAKLDELRRLSVGPKLGARVAQSDDAAIVIDVGEINGVQATLVEYEIEMTTRNHRAGLLTMFVWKTPEVRVTKTTGTFREKVSLRESSKKITVSNPIPPAGLASFLLGSQHSFRLTLKGYDEIGRPVSVSINRL